MITGSFFRPNAKVFPQHCRKSEALLRNKALPTALHRRCQKYKTSSLLSTTCLNKKVVLHKPCISLFNKQKLQRKRKSVESICLEKIESKQIDDIDRGIVLERELVKSKVKEICTELLLL